MIYLDKGDLLHYSYDLKELALDHIVVDNVEVEKNT